MATTGDSGSAGTIRFGGTEAAELFGRECGESLRGTLELSHVSQPGSPYPPGFVHASPPQSYWSGTCWPRDTGAFLRELALWGATDAARQTAEFLVERAPLDAEGFASYPEYFRGDEPRSPFEIEHDHTYHPATDNELDGTAAIAIALAILWHRTPAGDELRGRIASFLLGPASPLRGFHRRLASAPLLAGRGEFGGGTGPDEFCNVVQNYLASLALAWGARVADGEAHPGDAGSGGGGDAADWCRDADGIQEAMLRYLVDEEGCWLWCVDPRTLRADPAVLGTRENKGFTGVNAVGSLYADVYGLEPLRCDWKGIDCCRRTLERQLAHPPRRQQFERHGLWMQVDDPAMGLYCTPSYSGGYALQTMLLYEMPDRAARLAGWLAEFTYRAEEHGILFTNFPTGRMSPWYFFETYPSPDAVGRRDMLAGCGPLNLVNVAEPLKAARLMLGVEDDDARSVRIVPRLPAGWTSVEATDWPILTPEGVCRADVSFRVDGGRGRFRLRVRNGTIPALAVRLPLEGGWTWHRARDVRELEL